MDLLREAATIAIIVALVFGLNWLMRKSGLTGT